MIGYPLDSHVTYDEGIPQYDRAISSAPLRELFKRLFSDGVLPDVATNLMVQYVGSTRVAGTVSGDVETYNVIVNAGFGICAGCLKLQENFYGLTMNIADTSQPRIDTVVLRLNDNDAVRSCDFYIVQGTPAANPVAPALTRDSSIWEIGLANLHKPPVVSSVNPVTVTDTRLDPNRCGVISSISEFDTSALYKQVQDAMVHYQTVTEAEFEAWFNEIRDQLSEDAAGNLQAQIGALVNLVTGNKINLVGAINEVAGRSLASDVTVYVSKSGSDTTGNGSEANPFATISKAVYTIPKNLNGFEATVYIESGTYPEVVYIHNFSGGRIRLTGVSGGSVSITGMSISNCDVIIGEFNLIVGASGILISPNGYLYSANSAITVNGASNGVRLQYNSKLNMSRLLTVNNATSSALGVESGSTVAIEEIIGSGNNIGITINNAMAYVRRNSLSATTGVLNYNGTLNLA